jgi:uncharacterized protein YcnI
MIILNSKFKVQKLASFIVVLMLFLTSASLTMAHVVVKPNQVNVAAFQTFTVGVPNEKELPTVGLRLMIPDNLKHVSPNVKPGWNVIVKKSGEGEDAKVTEISWTGGSIPAGQRDDFLFSAQAPADAGAINWKAYQTYQDGTVVAWDQDPNAPKPSVAPGEEGESTTPYSVTKVVNDLASASTTPVVLPANQSGQSTSMIFSVAALLLSFAAIGLALRKN